MSGTQLRIGCRTVQLTTNNKGRIQTTLSQQTGSQAGGRGLAMGAGNTYAVAKTHQLGQHFGTRYHWYALLSCRHQFRVVCSNSRRHHHYITVSNMGCIMSDKDRNAHVTQTMRHRIFTQISTTHFITEVMHHLGNTTHPGPADTDKVHPSYPPHALWLGHGRWI